MATAAKVLKASLQLILVQASETDIEASEFDDAIFTMNNYMFALDAEGVKLGYTEVINISDEVTIPTGALLGTIYNVAIALATEYDGVIGPGLVDMAANGMSAMRKLGVTIGPSAYPSTLPVGSGNAGPCNNDRRFYPELEAQILAEATGAIGLETGTEEAI